MRPRSLHIRLVSGRVVQGGAARSVGGVWARVERSVRRTARKLTDDPELQSDLVQEAMIKLWQLDPSRIDLGSNVEIFYVRRMLINRMWDVLRAEWLRVFAAKADRRAG